MGRILLAPVFLLLIAPLSGCQKKAELAAGQAAPASAIATTTVERRSADTLAYEHTVSIELDKETLPRRMEEIEAACLADRASECTILEVSLHSTDDLPSGSIRMRLAPGGVNALIERASAEGRVASRTTQAEDLAQPIADVDRELALLSLHRDRLTEFMKSKELKIDQLIAVSKELATVQAQIESATATHANLRRRIDTDLLTINLSLPQRAWTAQRSPVMDALRDFGSEFREAIASIIRFLAVLLPWLVIIVPGIVLIRLFWRWISRWIARREAQARS